MRRRQQIGKYVTFYDKHPCENLTWRGNTNLDNSLWDLKREY